MEKLKKTNFQQILTSVILYYATAVTTATTASQQQLSQQPHQPLQTQGVTRTGRRSKANSVLERYDWILSYLANDQVPNEDGEQTIVKVMPNGSLQVKNWWLNVCRKLGNVSQMNIFPELSSVLAYQMHLMEVKINSLMYIIVNNLAHSYLCMFNCWWTHFMFQL